MKDHPALVWIGALASITAILSFLVQIDVIPLPWADDEEVARDPDLDEVDLGSFFCEEPALSLSSGAGSSGAPVHVVGTGFPADASVDLRFHTESLTPSRTDESGRFGVDVTIPGTFDPFAPAQFTIVATAMPSACSAETPFSLEP